MEDTVSCDMEILLEWCPATFAMHCAGCHSMFYCGNVPVTHCGTVHVHHVHMDVICPVPSAMWEHHLVATAVTGFSRV